MIVLKMHIYYMQDFLKIYFSLCIDMIITEKLFYAGHVGISKMHYQHISYWSIHTARL